MATDFKDNFDWHNLEDTDSEDDGDSGSGDDSHDSGKEKHEENKKEEEYFEEIQNKGKYSHGKQGGMYKSKSHQYNKHNEQSNFELYYKNDPDFFVKVIKLEEPPHELGIKFRKTKPNIPDLTKAEVTTKLKKFGVEEIELAYNSQKALKISAFIRSDSESAAKIYADLYDNVQKVFQGYLVNVYYERDREVLEKHADIAAEEYYKEQKMKKSKTNQQRPYKNYQDNRKSEEVHDPSSSLSGFNTGSGPHLYFNKKKSEATPSNDGIEMNQNSEELNIKESEMPSDSTTKTTSLKEESKEVKSESQNINKISNSEVNQLSESQSTTKKTDEKHEANAMKREKFETNKAESSHKEHKNQEDVVLKKRHEGQNKRRAPWTNKYSNLAPVESHIKETSPHKEEVQEIPEVVKEKRSKTYKQSTRRKEIERV